MQYVWLTGSSPGSRLEARAWGLLEKDMLICKYFKIFWSILNRLTQTWKTSSPPPTENWLWKNMENFSSVTVSFPFFSARRIRFNAWNEIIHNAKFWKIKSTSQIYLFFIFFLVLINNLKSYEWPYYNICTSDRNLIDVTKWL